MASGTAKAAGAGCRGPSVNSLEGAVQVSKAAAYPRLAFRLRALGAPMYLVETRKNCHELDLVPGRIYTVGRSRGNCDIVFMDRRVSRQHCLVYLDAKTNQVHLLEGAQLSDRKYVEIHDPRRSTTSLMALTKLRQTTIPSTDFKPTGSRSPLNGLYVDGKILSQGGHSILDSGSEVSLVACTENGCPLDLDFGEPIGFVIEQHLPCLETSAGQEARQSALCRPKWAGNEIDDVATNCCGKRSFRDLCSIRRGQEIADISIAEVPKSAVGKPQLQQNPFQRDCHSKRLDEDAKLYSGVVPGRLRIDGPHDKGRKSGEMRSIVSKGTTSLKVRTTKQRTKKAVLERLKTSLNPPSLHEEEGNNDSLHTTVSPVSTDLLESVGSSRSVQNKAAEKIPWKQLSDANCRFLSAQDCARRSDRDSKISSDGLPNLTNTIEAMFAVGSDIRSGRMVDDITSATVTRESHPNVGRPRSRVYKAVDETRHATLERRKGHSSSPSVSNDSDRSFVEMKRSSRRKKRSLSQTDFSNLGSETTNFASLGDETEIMDGTIYQSQTLEQSATEFLSSFDPKYQCGEKQVESPILKRATPLSELPSLWTPVANVGARTPTLAGTGSDAVCEKRSVEEMSTNLVHVAGQTPIELDESRLQAFEEHKIDSMGLLRDNDSQIETEGLNLRWSGSDFLLNKLTAVEVPQAQPEGGVTLEELLTPVHDLLGLFIATFTSDVLWFLSSQNIPQDLPVTIACHDRENCWSTAEESRSAAPFSSWPNVKLIYPPFPDSCCLATEKRQGIGCHHPKLFILPRKSRIRVIVTSANLTETQWLHVTNSVWWQDFPCKDVGGFESLFSMPLTEEAGLVHDKAQNDFAHHLSAFVGSLVADVPSAAHWAVDLALYDFSKAAAALVTSIPGLHQCPCPPVPQSMWDVNKDDSFGGEKGAKRSVKHLDSVRSKVVGVSHRFKDSADPTGHLIRALAAILSDTYLHEGGLLTVQLRRVTNLSVDSNAVAVVVSSDVAQRGKGMSGVQEEFLQTTNDLASSSPCTAVQIGFLPRATAKWVSPLFDSGLCTFAACIWPEEVLSLASGMSQEVAQLVLYVFKGPNFSYFSANNATMQQKMALSCLLQNIDRPLGLWRLHQVLSRFKWRDAAETDFFFGSSSIGTSLDAAFFASFAAAACKKVQASNYSSDSDSEWGTWTALHEKKNPSIGIVYPTIERVENATGGPFGHRRMLHFAESTWQRLQPARIFHDAVPFPPEREGIPTHTKGNYEKYASLHVPKEQFGMCSIHRNYELGIVFIDPPPSCNPRNLKFRPLSTDSRLDSEKDLKKLVQTEDKRGLDRFVLPFRVPPPKYRDADQPATGRAMYYAAMRCRYEELVAESNIGEEYDEDKENSDTDSATDEVEFSCESGATITELAPNLQIEEAYGDTLWSQMDSKTNAGTCSRHFLTSQLMPALI